MMLVLAVLLAGLGATSRARAATIWDNGDPDFPVGTFITFHQGADDFTLKSNFFLTGVRIWVFISLAAPDEAGAIDWAIHPDDSGTPGPALASGSSDAVLTEVDEEVVNPGRNFQVDFSVGSVPLSAGTYWLSIMRPPGTFDGFTTAGFWINNQTVMGNQAVIREIGADAWGVNSVGDRAFQLFGTAASPDPTTETPEPNTGALALGGIVALWFARRRLSASCSASSGVR